MKRVKRQEREWTSAVAALLPWYTTSHRPLPWRNNPDPYRIWVSEIMLQQTRVEAVIPYYTRWLDRFPTVDVLAESDLHDVLLHWEGLGYYSRARNLHSAARVVRERYQSAVPNTYDALRALPGIGDYTAGAIASIAYNERVPAVDGNVRRVLARIFDVPAPAPASVRELACSIVDYDRPGDFNQALMELGATVCTPRNPACAICPINPTCKALANGTIAQRPGKTAKKTIPHETVHTLLLVRDHRVLLEQRAEEGLLAHMWQFPAVANPPRSAKRLGEVTHVFSHKRVTYVVHHATNARRARERQRWVALNDLHAYPLPAAQRKIEKLIPAV